MIFLRRSFVALHCILLCAPVAAQPRSGVDYPARAIRVVVPYASGGGVDIVARIVAQKLASQLGQSMVIDNKGGAGGVFGTDLVAKSSPDGYTLLLTSSSYASTPFFFKDLPYDIFRDLVPVTLINRNFGQVMAINPSLPVRTVREFIELARKRPSELSYGSAGIGNVMHLAAELFSMMTKVSMTHVPYKGGAQAMSDSISGQIQLSFPAAHSTTAFIRSGRLRALAITGERRWNQMPEVPTLNEAGVTGYKLVGWYGFWFPAKTAKESIERIQSEVVRMLQDVDMKRRLEEQGLEGVGSTSVDLDRAVREEYALNRKLTSAIGITPQ